MLYRLWWLGILLIPTLAAAQTPVEAVRAYRQAHAADVLLDFADLLTRPNVASDSVHIHQLAAHLRDEFAARGAAMDLLKVPGAPPLVYGRIETPGATRTLGLYVHYDGQPVNEAEWVHGPWTPTLYTAPQEAGGQPRPMPQPGEAIDPEWRLYARSAGDDKAPLTALLTALDALQATGHALTSNLVFLFEGEEEAGSDHLGQYLEEYGALMEVDVWLIFDGPVHQSRTPQLVFGVRGVTSLELTVYGAARNLHSGHYGNWAPNPGMMLAQLLAGMKDADGNVTIDGFYASTLPLGATERAALAAVPDVEEALKQELGLLRTEGDGASLPERLLLPSLNVRGLASANVGAKARNVIPSTATAALDIRLVKGNDPEAMIDLVEAHIREQGYHIVREDPPLEIRLQYPRIAKVTRGSGYVAARTDMNDPLVAPLVQAVRQAAGAALILMPSLGGSLPLYLFTETLQKPVVIVPMANHDNNQHAPNENLRLANLWYGIDLMAALLTMNPQ